LRLGHTAPEEHHVAVLDIVCGYEDIDHSFPERRVAKAALERKLQSRALYFGFDHLKDTLIPTGRENA
jgi:hypothetical protein